MLRRTPIFIVASPRPRVGKTLLARALVEYLYGQRRPVSAFDINPDNFALLERLPPFTAAASIHDTRGEMALFDQLVMPDLVPKVIDLGHAQFDRFFTVMQAINFCAETRRKAIVPMVLFVADPDQRARQGYAMLRDRFPDLPLIPVLNEAVPVVARYGGNFPPTPRGGSPVGVPALTPALRGVIDRLNFTFIGYLSKTTDPTAELYQWAWRLFLIFRELEVRLLLGELKPQPLRHSA